MLGETAIALRLITADQRLCLSATFAHGARKVKGGWRQERKRGGKGKGGREMEIIERYKGTEEM